MRNFDYLKEFPYLVELHGYCHAAEETQFRKPKDSAHKSRQALEWIVRTIYELKGIEITKEMTLFTLMDGMPFREFIDDDRLMMGANYIRRCEVLGYHTEKELELLIQKRGRKDISDMSVNDNIVNDAPFNEYDIFGIFGERTTQFGRYVKYIHEAVG